MNNDCVEVDELILEIADYKNDYVDIAAEKLLWKCSTSWEAYQYLQDRAHDGWLSKSARQQLRRIIKKIRSVCFRAANAGGYMSSRERRSIRLNLLEPSR
jgi:hypothetical protein